MTLVDGIGAWAEVLASPSDTAGRPALFLDRDGVVVHEVGFLRRPEDVELMPGAAQLIKGANAHQIAVVIVTNQSGIARSLLTWADFEGVQGEIERQLTAAGARVDAVFACGYHGDGQGALGAGSHPWRKPNPGMLLAAEEALRVDLGKSWIIGDRSSDVAAGQAAGIEGGIHVMTGHATDAEREASLSLAGHRFRVESAPDVLSASAVLARQPGSMQC